MLGVSFAGLRADDFFDFGLKVENFLKAHSEQLFGITQPLDESALGTFDGTDNTQAVSVAKGLTVSVISNVTHPEADQIALWPDDAHPTHAFVAVEGEATDPCLQVVDLRADPNNNVRTILMGLVSADPIRRTPWGTLIVAEEESDGGFYEIFNPLGITSPIIINDRAAGTNTTNDPRVIKRRAVGSLAWEGIVILENGTMYYGDELRPSTRTPGGAIYKFVPNQPPDTSVTPETSPFAGGTLYGMRLGTREENTDFGQGTEIGKGIWVLIDPHDPSLPPETVDSNGNFFLRNAQQALGLTGYYRPEDMDQDPNAAAKGITRVCWTNTGNMTNGGNSAVEGAAIYGEVMSLVDELSEGAVSGTIPFVTRFISGNPDANFFDNVDFQPKSGRLVVCEDGEVEVVKDDGSTELRGNDVWMYLPDGMDRDVQSDGSIRILSLRDISSEPTGFIFNASGEQAYVNIQHRDVGVGALLKISGFKVH
jgi:secreted PhoX family phosphatase